MPLDSGQSKSPKVRVIKKAYLQEKKAESLDNARAEHREPSSTVEFRAPRVEESTEEQEAKNWVNDSLKAIRAREKYDRENLFGGKRK
jgi:hypothetical protein